MGDGGVLIPTSPSAINLKKIGEAFYTNVTYEENYYDLRFTKGKMKVMNVNIPSMNVMFSARERNGQFRSMASAQADLALIFTYVRGEIGEKFLNGDITNSEQATEYMQMRTTGLMTSWFGFGNAQLRTPYNWSGTAKSNLIYLFP
jgi:hypothetical protein